MSGNPRDRKNWTLSMTIALLVAAGVAVLGSLVGEKSVATNRYYLESSAGNVLFDHGTHSDTADSCATCHHTLYGAAQAISCEECHADYEPEDFEHGELKEFHDRDCSGCHEQVAEDDQAASCRDCHLAVRESETNLVSCSECHDDDYQPEMMDHDEYQEIEDHTCLGCHSPRALAETYHTSCSDCHLEEAADRFALSDGSVNCSGCHLR